MIVQVLSPASLLRVLRLQQRVRRFVNHPAFATSQGSSSVYSEPDTTSIVKAEAQLNSFPPSFRSFILKRRSHVQNANRYLRVVRNQIDRISQAHTFASRHLPLPGEQPRQTSHDEHRRGRPCSTMTMLVRVFWSTRISERLSASCHCRSTTSHDVTICQDRVGTRSSTFDERTVRNAFANAKKNRARAE